MSDTFATGKTFQTGEQVTANDLNNAVNQATPKVALTDDLSITVNASNKLTVKDGDSTNGVQLSKLKHQPGPSVIGNIGSTTSALTNIQVGANEAVLGNSAGNGLITEKIDTDNIKDDAVTQGKTSFIDSNGGMTLTGSSPRVILDDDGNSGTDPYIIADDSGSIGVYSTRANADVIIDGKDEVRIRHDGTNGLTVAADAGKNEGGSNVAGAKVTGGLYVTGDVYADDHVVADHILLQGDAPNITFNDSDVGTPNAYITGNGTGTEQKLLMYAPKGGSDIATHSTDNFTVKVTDNPTSDHDQSTNPYVERFRVAHDAGKDSGGTLSAGAKVTGDLQVTGDVNVAGVITGQSISGGINIDADSGTTHEILLGETLTVAGGEGVDTTINNNTLTISGENATNSNKGIAQFSNNNFTVSNGIVTIKNGGVNNDELEGSIANDKLANSSISVTAGAGLSGGGSASLGGTVGIGLTNLLPDGQRAVTQASTDNSQKVATTEFVQNVAKSLSSGYTTLATGNTSGTASSDGFLVVSYRANSTGDDGEVTVTIGSETFESFSEYNDRVVDTYPIASGESYSVSFNETSLEKVRFKALS